MKILYIEHDDDNLYMLKARLEPASVDFESLLAWNVGELADAAALDDAVRQRSSLRSAAPSSNLPTVASSQRFPRQACRVADILLFGSPWQTCSTFNQVQTDLDVIRRLAVPVQR